MTLSISKQVEKSLEKVSLNLIIPLKYGEIQYP